MNFVWVALLLLGSVWFSLFVLVFPWLFLVNHCAPCFSLLLPGSHWFSVLSCCGRKICLVFPVFILVPLSLGLPCAEGRPLRGCHRSQGRLSMLHACFHTSDAPRCPENWPSKPSWPEIRSKVGRIPTNSPKIGPSRPQDGQDTSPKRPDIAPRRPRGWPIYHPKAPR